ncbi:hypothetical protein [Anaerotruncus rubiinfantis]|uniref:hypothetical protein n=1 Tax=Anaerotruncus rubiinfantis TaxID=1720200 RepID=UPI0034A27953
MNQSKLEEIYTDFINGDIYGTIPKTEYARILMSGVDQILEKVSDKDLRGEFQDAVGRAESAGEVQGFVLGFKYAVQLLGECADAGKWV